MIYNYKWLLRLDGLTAEVATDQSSLVNCSLVVVFSLSFNLLSGSDSHKISVSSSTCKMDENLFPSKFKPNSTCETTDLRSCVIGWLVVT